MDTKVSIRFSYVTSSDDNDYVMLEVRDVDSGIYVMRAARRGWGIGLPK